MMLVSGRCYDAIIESKLRRFKLRQNGWTLHGDGSDGLGAWIHKPRRLAVIHSIADELDGEVWVHLSISCKDGFMPSWEQCRDVFREFCGDDALGIIVIPPKSEHVDLAEVAHVWQCLTKRPTPDFTHGGRSI